VTVGQATAVVLTRNRRAEVLRTVARLCERPDPPAAVIVVDNASTDDTAAAIRTTFPDVVLVRLARNEGAAGRNAGIRLAATPYVALCDDDTWWADGSLAAAAAVLDAHPRLAVVTARVLVGPEAREDPACAPMATSPLPADPAVPGRPILGFLAGASMVRVDAFLATGGFERRLFLGGEEQLVALDLASSGWTMAYVPHLAVHHHPSPARDARARRRLLVRNAIWCAMLRRRWPGALGTTLRVVAEAWPDRERRRGLLDAVGGLPWTLRERRPVSPAVERAVRLVERAARRSAA